MYDVGLGDDECELNNELNRTYSKQSGLDLHRQFTKYYNNDLKTGQINGINSGIFAAKSKLSVAKMCVTSSNDDGDGANQIWPSSPLPLSLSSSSSSGVFTLLFSPTADGHNAATATKSTLPHSSTQDLTHASYEGIFT